MSNVLIMPSKSEFAKSFKDTYARLFSPFTLFVFGACWLLAVLAGPFGTYEAMSFGLRAVYWFVVVAGAIVAGFGVRAVSVVVFDSRRPLLSDLGAAALLSVVFTPYVIVIRGLFSQMSNGLVVSPVSIALNTFLLALAVFVLRRQLVPEEPGSYLVPDQAAAVQPQTGPPQLPRLLRRLPPELQGDVLRLSANDHKIEVVTSNGVETLRLRLNDAIAEMEPVEGLCTHRSHWVSVSAIQGVEKENAHKLFVVLRNGDRVPVSRKYRADLEARGVIRTKGTDVIFTG